MKKVEKRKKKLEVKKEKVRPLTDDDLDKVAGGTMILSQACMSAIKGSGGAGSRPPSAMGGPTGQITLSRGSL